MSDPSETNLLPKGAVVNGYKIIELICPGKLGGVYKVKEKKSGKIFILKIESFDTKLLELPTEIRVLKDVKGSLFPKIRDSGNNERFQSNFVVMNCLGMTLADLQTFHAHRLNVELVYHLAFKMLQCIQTLHSIGYIHRDIKPKNFLIQQNPDYPVVLIDFNLCEKIDLTTGQCISIPKDKTFVGTEKYASINALQLLPPERGDDLFSWFYSFLDLVNGSLPWEDAKTSAEIIDMRNVFKIADLNYKFPKEIQQLYDFLRSLRYDEKPDYNRIKELLEGAMKSEGYDTIKPYDFTDFLAKHAKIIDFDEKMEKMKIQYAEMKQRREKLREQKEKNKERDKLNNLDEDSEKKKKHHKIKNIFKPTKKPWFY